MFELTVARCTSLNEDVANAFAAPPVELVELPGLGGLCAYRHQGERAGGGVVIRLSVYDETDADLTSGNAVSQSTINSPSTSSAWQVGGFVASGFTPVRCVVALEGAGSGPADLSSPSAASGVTTTTTTQIPDDLAQLQASCDAIGGRWTDRISVFADWQTPYGCEWYDSEAQLAVAYVTQDSGAYSYATPLPEATPEFRALNGAAIDCSTKGNGALVWMDKTLQCLSSGPKGDTLTINGSSWSWDFPLSQL